MSSIGTGYDLSASQFSPEGRVFQIDYAHKAVEKSGTVIGLRNKTCVILAVENIGDNKMSERNASNRIFTIDRNIGMAVAGVMADGRFIVDIARQEALNYYQQFERTIPLRHLSERISAYMHAYTLYSAVRPFGVTVILAGFNRAEGAQLYKIQPSGSSFGYFACASGKGKVGAKTELEKLNFRDMTTDELVKAAGRIIYQVRGESSEKESQMRLDMSVVGEDETEGNHIINPEKYKTMADEAGLAAGNEEDSDTDQ